MSEPIACQGPMITRVVFERNDKGRKEGKDTLEFITILFKY